MDGWLGFNGILSTQVAAISCLKNFKVNPVWHRMLYSCSHIATVGVRGLK